MSQKLRHARCSALPDRRHQPRQWHVRDREPSRPRQTSSVLVGTGGSTWNKRGARRSSIARRDFLKLAGGLAATAVVSESLWNKALAAPVQSGTGPYGALRSADANGIMLPAGFSSRVIARAGSRVGNTSYTWHNSPDGGATFAASGGGYVYVSNSEVSSGGGAGAISFDASGNVTSARRICANTRSNCAGGKTPWGTWLSCEEYDGGNVSECDPHRSNSHVRRRALGSFAHEAAAVDPATGYLYMTEDKPDGRFYRFRPTRDNDLSAGTLEVARVSGESVTWLALPRPTASGLSDPLRYQVSSSKAFNGGEGIVHSLGVIYFTTKGDNRVWEYSPSDSSLSVLYDVSLDSGRQLTGIDNIAASSGGDLIVAEDGGNMELVVITPEGEAAALLRVTGQDSSEITGPAFDPSGTRLYFSSQRGGSNGRGITYEVRGPFRR